MYVRSLDTVVNLESCTDLSLITAAAEQLTRERDGLAGKIAKLERRAEELQNNDSRQ